MASWLLSFEERRACKTPPDIQRVRVVLWGDNVKDEEGYRAILSEPRPSASQMAVAKFLDTISMLPGVTGETRDAILACTQVKMIEAPRLLRSVSQWNKACDSRLLSLINYINQTKNYKQLLYRKIRLKVALLVSDKMLHLQAACGIQKSTSGTLLSEFGSTHVCSLFSGVQEANRSFSHSSAESETVSLDAGLRMHGFYQLYNWRVCW